MIYILTFAILVLAGIIVCLNIEFRKSKAGHRKKIQLLQEIIVQMASSQHANEDRLRISEELREKLRSAQTTINTDIRDMVHDFIEVLAKNNLLDK